jgi:hypothetical protein
MTAMVVDWGRGWGSSSQQSCIQKAWKLHGFTCKL